MSIMTNSPRFDDDDEEKKQKKEEPFADRFLKTRQIILTGEINKDLADSIARQLLILDSENNEPIYMYIDSPGGDVDAGFAIYDVIRFVKAPVYLVGMGLIASAATLVLLAVDKDRRVGLPNSRYLIHQPLGGVRGVATDIEIYAKDMEKIRIKPEELDEAVMRGIQEEDEEQFAARIRDAQAHAHDGEDSAEIIHGKLRTQDDKYRIKHRKDKETP